MGQMLYVKQHIFIENAKMSLVDTILLNFTHTQTFGCQLRYVAGTLFLHDLNLR